MRPALVMAVAMAMGIAAAAWVRPHFGLTLAVLALCLAGAARSHRRTAAVLAVVAALGMCRYSFAQTAGRGSIGAWEGQRVQVTGTVVSEPEVLSTGSVAYTVAVEEVEGHPARGQIWVLQKGAGAPGYGDRIQTRGHLQQPPGASRPGAFDRAAYLARQGIFFSMEVRSVTVTGPGRLDPVRRAAVALRHRMEGVLKTILPDGYAALMAGLLLGSRSDLPGDVSQAFRESGVFHLLAVSGGNVAMILIPFLALLRRIGFRRRWAAAGGIPLVAFFILLTGSTPSVLRAGLMAILMLLGDLLGRERDALNTLGASVLLLLMASPRLLFDVGFQLSVAATLGILLLTRPLQNWMAPWFQSAFGQQVGHWVAEGLAVTFAAQLMVEPLCLYYFGSLSPVAPLANLLVSLCQGPVVYLGTVSLLTGLVLMPLARLLGALLQVGLWILVFLVKATAAVPGGYLEVGRLPLPWVVAWYGILWLLVGPGPEAVLGRGAQIRQWARQQGEQWRFHLVRQKSAMALVMVLAAIASLTWRQVLAGTGDLLTVHFLDVGQGDAILIRSPEGRTMLVDAGPFVPAASDGGQTAWDAGEQVVVPFLQRQGVKRLDVLVLTHADQDHAGGAPAVLKALSVGTLWHAGPDQEGRRYQKALQLAREAGTSLQAPVAGERFTLGSNVTVEVLNPPAEKAPSAGSDDNGRCMALRVTYRQVSFLLACDLEEESEARLVSAGIPLEADVLKVAHHGAQGSTSQPFLDAVNPSWAVLSVGSGNRYGHPHSATLERLKAKDVTLFRTDRHGTVTFWTDGIRIWATGRRGGSPEKGESRPVGLLGRPLLFAW